MSGVSVEPLGRILLVAGIAIAVAGAVILVGGRIPFLGNLPGDLRIERDHVTILIPLGTILLVSIGASIVLALLGRR
jgi:hypothetical protein